MKIRLIKYWHNNSGGQDWLDDKQWQDLLDAGWFKYSYRTLARYGLSEEDAIEEWEKITRSYSWLEGCECCGRPHNFNEEDDEPRYKHDCGGCTYLGSLYEKKQLYDLYWCQQAIGGPTVIARFGDDGPDYLSGMIFAENGSSAPLVEARKRAISLGLQVD